MLAKKLSCGETKQRAAKAGLLLVVNGDIGQQQCQHNGCGGAIGK